MPIEELRTGRPDSDDPYLSAVAFKTSAASKYQLPQETDNNDTPAAPSDDRQNGFAFGGSNRGSRHGRFRHVLAACGGGSSRLAAARQSCVGSLPIQTHVRIDAEC